MHRCQPVSKIMREIGVIGEARLILFRHAAERRQRPGPAVALVVDEALHQHDEAFRIVLHARRRAQDRGHVGVTARRQIADHLHVRVHAGRDLAQQLEHCLLAQRHRAVGLLGGEPFRGGIERHVEAVERGEPVFRVPSRHDRPLAHRAQHRLREIGHREPVGQQADLAAAPDAGDRQIGGERSVWFTFPSDAKRQRVGGGAVARLIRWGERVPVTA